MNRYEVCDPSADPDAWTEVHADDAKGAALRFLVVAEWREKDFEPGAPFVLLVRRDGGEPTKVRIRVVPARFEAM